MVIYSTVERAVNIAVGVLESHHTTFSESCIRHSIMTWYDNSDVADPEILAACALMGVDWYPGVTYAFMCYAREICFGSANEHE